MIGLIWKSPVCCNNRDWKFGTFEVTGYLYAHQCSVTVFVKALCLQGKGQWYSSLYKLKSRGYEGNNDIGICREFEVLSLNDVVFITLVTRTLYVIQKLGEPESTSCWRFWIYRQMVIIFHCRLVALAVEVVVSQDSMLRLCNNLCIPIYEIMKFQRLFRCSK
jgi:hypothetical protein